MTLDAWKLKIPASARFCNKIIPGTIRQLFWTDVFGRYFRTGCTENLPGIVHNKKSNAPSPVPSSRSAKVPALRCLVEQWKFSQAGGAHAQRWREHGQLDQSLQNICAISTTVMSKESIEKLQVMIEPVPDGNPGRVDGDHHGISIGPILT